MPKGRKTKTRKLTKNKSTKRKIKQSGSGKKLNNNPRKSRRQRFRSWLSKKKRYLWPPQKIVELENNSPVGPKTPPNITETIETSKSDKLGEGQFGIVSKSYSKCSPVFHGASLLLASKSLKDDATESDTQDFLRESHILWQLQPHPNIVKMFGYQDLPKGKRIIVEFCNMGELRSWLIEPNNNPKSTVLYDICIDIANGMKHIHENNYIHRDLAARNILLSSENGKIIAKVSDFGLAVEINNEDNQGFYRQTKELFMPIRWLHPISITESIYSKQTDVWSYGVTVWEIFSKGVIPYKGLDNKRMISAVTDGYILPKPKACPKMLYDDIVRNCLTKDIETPLTFEQISTTLTQKQDALGDYLDTGESSNNESNNNPGNNDSEVVDGEYVKISAIKNKTNNNKSGASKKPAFYAVTAKPSSQDNTPPTPPIPPTPYIALQPSTTSSNPPTSPLYNQTGKVIMTGNNNTRRDNKNTKKNKNSKKNNGPKFYVPTKQ